MCEWSESCGLEQPSKAAALHMDVMARLAVRRGCPVSGAFLLDWSSASGEGELGCPRARGVPTAAGSCAWLTWEALLKSDFFHIWPERAEQGKKPNQTNTKQNKTHTTQIWGFACHFALSLSAFSSQSVSLCSRGQVAKDRPVVHTDSPRGNGALVTGLRGLDSNPNSAI